MTETPDLTLYFALHDAMRRSSTRLHEAVQTADRGRSRAISRWFTGFVGELRMHHTVEDDVFFPALAERVPTFDEHGPELAGDHHRMDEILDDLGATLRRVADSLDWAPDHETAVRLAAELRDLLDVHLDHEDADVVPLFARHFSAEEYDGLRERADKIAFDTKQAFWTVPWLVANVDDATKQKLMVEAPLPLRIVWYLSRRRYARSERAALGAYDRVASS